ncbi:MAG TPA: carbamoyltransferase HypF [Gemmatimonadales bacterium]|nr:carbamoyltransferase HypF [Gemmatimonadales bacterium]
MTSAPATARAAYRLQVTGLVQGVGFRPFVHRLAQRHHLGGWVRNTSGDVQIAVEGDSAELDAFVGELRAEAPPLARIAAVGLQPAAPEGLHRFVILASAPQADRRQPVSPDVATCSACEAELFDPANRRYGYPFITCTDCGPRYTVIEAMPYDRERSSMARFRQCPACLAEYGDPGDRRYHSETNSCPQCGPRVWFAAGGPAVSDTRAALAGAVRLLLRGGILALRGLGGFHLAVDAGDRVAVARLRARKRRHAKPLAVMVRSLEEVLPLAWVNDAEAALLRSPERPIVLLDARPDSPVAPGVAPGLGQLGVMLAYTPLHHLLLEAVGRPLVMTSGNLAEEPIAIANRDALSRLAGIADGFLLHDREIVARYDDSVVRVVCGAPLFLRRARGYAPLPLALPVASPRPLLAVGPHLKNTLTLAQGSAAYLSQHIGDLESVETLEHFQATLAAHRRLFQIAPEVGVHDLHPGYLSSRLVDELGFERVIAVQHHHAHIAAVLAEHGITEPVLGVAYDGTGFGGDGTTWGAEVLLADLTGYRRVGHLLPAPLPGGDRAVREPWRTALGYWSLDPGLGASFAAAWSGVDPRERELAERQIIQRLNAPLASSMGRLFDAAAAILGLRRTVSYEGQAAMELEALAGRRPGTEYPGRFLEREGTLVFDPLPLLAMLGVQRARGADPADLAADFHASIAAATAELVRRLAQSTGRHTVALGGGAFQNARLLETLRGHLESLGLVVLIPRQLSPNDGAISYGQAAVGAALLAAEAED